MNSRNQFTLGELCEIQRGGSPRPIDQYITDSENGVNWIKIGDVAEGEKYIYTTKEKIKPEGANRSRHVAAGDFLLTNSMSFGRPYILRTSGCIHDGWLVLRYDKARLDEDYLYRVLSSDLVYAQFVKLAAGAVVKNLNSDVVKQVTIPVPSIEEQRRIAAILDKADALRAKRREALALLGGMAQAIFVDMFGSPVRNPKNWPTAKLGEVGTLDRGVSKHRPRNAPKLLGGPYEHWIWDDKFYAPREMQGFYTKSELELLIQRRASRKKLGETLIDGKIIERHYQNRAVRRVGETFEKDNQRKSLLVMATGSGKTRTVIALADVLMRANWVKRVLFLADRVALVNQAVNAFKAHLPSSSPVNLVTEKNTDGRVYVSTYPTMMKLIDESFDGQRRFGVGYFDLVIIDEAHRSVYQKYRSIFRYFDSLLVGLTATPRDEIDKNTYGLFDLEPGVPTDAYSLDDAVAEGYLVPPVAVSVPLKFHRQGIRYDELSEEEKQEWDEKEWNDEGITPNEIDSEDLNKWLFNADTVDKALEVLMQLGHKVAGGDRLGKTIIFAKNNDHADFIAKRFDVNYPHYKGQFARVVTYKTEYAQSLIDDFSDKEIVQELTQNGVMEAARLFESPFTDINAQGPLGVFPAATVTQIVQVLAEIRERAVA